MRGEFRLKTVVWGRKKVEDGLTTTALVVKGRSRPGRQRRPTDPESDGCWPALRLQSAADAGRSRFLVSSSARLPHLGRPPQHSGPVRQSSVNRSAPRRSPRHPWRNEIRLVSACWPRCSSASLPVRAFGHLTSRDPPSEAFFSLK